MIVGLGIDIVELDRIEKGLSRFGDKFARRILTEAEFNAMPEKNPVPYLAARFAAKEAASKALGTGFSQGVTMHSLEVVKGNLGKPEMKFHDRALTLTRSMNVKQIQLSLTHGRDTAAAVVILEE